MARELRDLSVLIVEDNVRNYALLARLLSFMGVRQTEWKRSGWHVLEFAQETMPQVCEVTSISGERVSWP
jgi:two-component system cell cycle response regulator DivK